jgi:hypothetical protein
MHDVHVLARKTMERQKTAGNLASRLGRIDYDGLSSLGLDVAE